MPRPFFQGDPVEIARVIKDSVKQSLKSFHEEARHSLISTPERKLALIIDGRCLMYALDPTLRVDLLGLSLICHSVICCRVSPLQKAQVNNISCSTTYLLPREELTTILLLVRNTLRPEKESMQILLISMHLVLVLFWFRLQHTVHMCLSSICISNGRPF